MKIYITLNNLFYILDNLDSTQKELWEKFITRFEENPNWLDFTNYWFNEATKKLGGWKREEDGMKITNMPRLPIFKIGQDLESRLGIKQGMVQRSFEGPEKFLYEDVEEVLGYCQKLLDKDQRNPLLHNVIGEIIINKQDPEFKKAMPYFQKAIELFPGYRQAHYNLGRAYLHEGMESEARSQVEMLRKIWSKEYAKMLEDEINKVTS